MKKWSSLWLNRIQITHSTLCFANHAVVVLKRTHSVVKLNKEQDQKEDYFEMMFTFICLTKISLFSGQQPDKNASL